MANDIQTLATVACIHVWSCQLNTIDKGHPQNAACTLPSPLTNSVCHLAQFPSCTTQTFATPAVINA